MNLTDSSTGCGGTCNPGVKAKGKLPACGDANTPPDPNANPPEEPSLFYQCAQQLRGDSNRDDESNLATGGVPAEVCGTTCIVILLKGTPPGSSAGAGPFTFTATGTGVDDPSSFQMTLNAQAVQAKAFGNLQPDPPAGERCFIITDFPPGGAQGDFQLDQVIFSSELGSTGRILYSGTGNSKTKIGACATKVVEGDSFYWDMHVH